MRINFKSFPVYTGIKKENKIPVNISLVISEGIYGNIAGIQAHSLAMKIYQSDGDVELGDMEVGLLYKAMDLFVGIIADSVRDYIDEQSKE